VVHTFGYHPHVHTPTHAHTRTHTHAYIHTYIHTYTHTHQQQQTRTYQHTLPTDRSDRCVMSSKPSYLIYLPWYASCCPHWEPKWQDYPHPTHTYCRQHDLSTKASGYEQQHINYIEKRMLWPVAFNASRILGYRVCKPGAAPRQVNAALAHVIKHPTHLRNGTVIIAVIIFQIVNSPGCVGIRIVGFIA